MPLQKLTNTYALLSGNVVPRTPPLFPGHWIMDSDLMCIKINTNPMN